MGATIHLVLQKKGGAGKSLISSAFYQYLLTNGHSVMGIDTDPSNKTFAKYKALKIVEFELLGSDKKVDARMFDTMLEAIYKLPEGSHVVIDSGASCFHDLVSYFVESNALTMLQEHGHEPYFHIPIIGGSGVTFSAECFGELAETFPSIPIYVWKNYYFGEISFRNKPFDEFDVYENFKARVEGIVEIPHRNPVTFGKDIEIMQAQGMTYDEIITSATMPLMTRQRMKTFWNEISAAIGNSMVF